MRATHLAGAAATAAFLLSAGPASAATFTVSDSENAGPGTLRQAILNANATDAPDVIEFNVGSTGSTIDLEAGLPIIAKPLTISGPTGSRLTVRSFVDTPVTVFSTANAGAVTLRDLTISGGIAGSGVAAGIEALNTALTLERMHITGNRNTSSGAGGINTTGGSLTLSRSTVSGNTADAGGNQQNYGVGVNVGEGTTATIVDSTIAQNTATNTTNAPGINLYGYDSNVTVESSTIAGAVTSGTGPRSSVMADATATVTMRNSIVSDASATIDNCSTKAGGSFVSTGFNLRDDATCAFAQPTDQAPADPRLEVLTAAGSPTPYLAPGAGSPAIDAGSAGTSGPTDQRGATRTVDQPSKANASGGDGTDIGAVEAALPPVPTVPPGIVVPVTPPKDIIAPKLSKASLAPKRVQVGKGTRVRFTSSEAGTARITFYRERKGRKKGKSCVLKAKKGKSCTKLVSGGSLSAKARVGTNTVLFKGKLKDKNLYVGTYSVRIVVTDAAGNKSKTTALKLTVVKPAKKK